MSRNLKFEICVDSPDGALAARKGGADRVELCDNLIEGGTTPSLGAIETARRILDIKLHVIVRPRGGDFLYSDIEFETMKRDIEAAKRAGADGVVFGILRRDGSVDKDRIQELVELSRPMAVTFHRAFDVCQEPFQAMEDLIDAGIDRLLTSGQRPTAMDGKDLIAEIVAKAGSRLTVMACGSLDEQNIGQVLAATGASEYHFAAFEELKSPMEFRNDQVMMGGEEAGSEYLRQVTSAERVAAIIGAARSAQ